MRILWVFIGVLVLSGCASRQEIASRVAAGDDAQCRSYGAAPGSDAYIGCRSRLSAAHTNAEAIAANSDDGPHACTKIGTTTLCN